MSTIPGYDFGNPALARSPLTEQDFEKLKRTVLFDDNDIEALHMASGVLADQIEDVLDVWYGFVAASPQLVVYFAGSNGQPDGSYLAAVRKRFGQWIRDTAGAKFDREWLDYQYEIGLRHTRVKKNKTDGVQSTSDVIHLRYLIAFIYPITATVRPFLAKKGHSESDVERMFQAWFKAVTLTAVLWSQPYVASQDF